MNICLLLGKTYLTELKKHLFLLQHNLIITLKEEEIHFITDLEYTFQIGRKNK